MARPYKQMPGKAFQIYYHADNSVTVKCAYWCPYCGLDAVASFEAKSKSKEIVEKEPFCEPLRCNNCGKITDVRFFPSNRIKD